MQLDAPPIDLNRRVCYIEKGWFGKTVSYPASGLVQVEREDAGPNNKVTHPFADFREATEAENNARLYADMVDVFLKAAFRGLERDYQQGNIPVFGDGDPFTLTYTAPFGPKEMQTLAKRRGISLPRVRIITSL